jgi:hypothetical protein
MSRTTKIFKTLEKEYKLIEDKGYTRMDWYGYTYLIDTKWYMDKIYDYFKNAYETYSNKDNKRRYYIHAEYYSYDSRGERYDSGSYGSEIRTLYISRFNMNYCGGLQTHDYLFKIYEGHFSYGVQATTLKEIKQLLYTCLSYDIRACRKHKLKKLSVMSD